MLAWGRIPDTLVYTTATLRTAPLQSGAYGERETTMKKSIAVLSLTIAGALGLAACGGYKVSAPSGSASASASASATASASPSAAAQSSSPSAAETTKAAG